MRRSLLTHRIAAARSGSAALLCLLVLSCGGGGSSDISGNSGGSGGGGGGGGGGSVSGPNVVAVAVSPGPNTQAALNTLYTTVTVCVPNTTTCQTIDNIQVDTGSYGLRLLSQVVTLTLPVAMLNNSSLLECTTFVDGYSWGPVALVDLTIGGEKAASLPVQLIGDKRFPTVPTDCQNAGTPTEEDTVAQFGANGLLGIGPFAQDCGPTCAQAAQAASYYTCTSASSCIASAVPVNTQVQNPVTLFATDNNGVIIELPSVAGTGATGASGSLIFGIGTESNNGIGSRTVLAVGSITSSSPLPGNFFTTFQGMKDESFIDSGSNGYYFTDPNLPTCASPNNAFYCPASVQTLSATLQGATGTSAEVSFSIGNLDNTLTSNPTFIALPDLGGTLSISNTFDWGLPFFYGRGVAYAIAGASTSAGTGPYVAF
jgi:hypothetical protein